MQSVCKSEGTRGKKISEKGRGGKKGGLIPAWKIAVTLMMCCEQRERYPRFLLWVSNPTLSSRHSPDPSWPHRWTFEKQSLESVPSNGFIKEVIILQQGRRCQWEIKWCLPLSNPNKALHSGPYRISAAQRFFKRGKELFLLFLLPPPLSTEDLSALIKSEFSRLSSAAKSRSSVLE